MRMRGGHQVYIVRRGLQQTLDTSLHLMKASRMCALARRAAQATRLPWMSMTNLRQMTGERWRLLSGAGQKGGLSSNILAKARPAWVEQSLPSRATVRSPILPTPPVADVALHQAILQAKKRGPAVQRLCHHIAANQAVLRTPGVAASLKLGSFAWQRTASLAQHYQKASSLETDSACKWHITTNAKFPVAPIPASPWRC